MARKNKKKKRNVINAVSIASIAVTDDPIEIHILDYLEKLRYQNMRLKTHVEKSGVWAELKETQKWKPYDFFHYFCNLYQQKYKKEYRTSGNIVRAYQRIELFIQTNSISNEEYREFIELAFARYFNEMRVPIVGSICSATLYDHLIGGKVRDVSSKDWYDLDRKIKLESDRFKEYIENEETEELKLINRLA